jgi:hypothetical protein
MKRTKAQKRQPRVIDVEPVEVETRAVAVPRPVRTDAKYQGSFRDERYIPREEFSPIRPVPAPGAYSLIDPSGRLDVSAYRFATEFALPWAEGVMGVPGLAAVLTPWAECVIAEFVPNVNVFKAAPKPRRRLR